jgi:hypothetical protein
MKLTMDYSIDEVSVHMAQLPLNSTTNWTSSLHQKQPLGIFQIQTITECGGMGKEREKEHLVKGHSILEKQKK